MLIVPVSDCRSWNVATERSAIDHPSPPVRYTSLSSVLPHIPLQLSCRSLYRNVDSDNYLAFVSVINQLDAQNFCFTISLFHASTCFEHMCSTSGGQNCITQPLVSSHLWVAGRLVHRFREDSLNLCTRWPPIGVMIPEAVKCNFDLLMLSTCARSM